MQQKMDIKELKETEWCPEFEKYMKNRLVMGAFRYGRMKDQDFGKYDLVAEAKKRMDKYLKDRNLEHLVDAANMMLLAYIHGKRKGEKLKAVDDGEHSKAKY